MWQENSKLIIISICLILTSCSWAGIEHYYKSNSNNWIIMIEDDPQCCCDTNVTPFLRVAVKDTFTIYNILLGTNVTPSRYFLGMYYVNVIPNIFFWGIDKRYFYISFRFNIFPYHSEIAMNEIKFYFNDDSTNIVPKDVYKDDTFKIFVYGWDFQPSDVEKLRIHFGKVTINRTDIDLPDVILDRNWRFVYTMMSPH